MKEYWLNLPIRKKFIIIIIAITSITSILGFIIINTVQSNKIRLEKQNDIILKAKLISNYVVTSIIFPDSSGAVDIMQKTNSIKYINSLAIYDSTGILFANYSKKIYSYLPHKLIGYKNRADSINVMDQSIILIIPITYLSRIYGYLYVDTDIGSISEWEVQMMWVSSFTLLITLILSFLLAFYSQKILFNPLLKLTYLTSSVTENEDYGMRSKPKSTDEVGTLMRSFNKMMDKIENTINELDDAQANLRHSEERYRGLVNNSPIPIFILRNNICNYTNLAGIELLGGSIFNIINHEFNSFLEASSAKEFNFYFSPEKLKEHETSSRELKVINIQGEIVYINVTGIKINEFGEYSVVLMCINVTDKKIAEQQIMKLNANLENQIDERTKELQFAMQELTDINNQLVIAEKEMRQLMEEADRANKAKTEFIANMSHEIRTPLNSIIGFSDILMKKIDDPDQVNYLNSIVNSGDSLLSIINDILDISKIEAGQIQLRPSKVNLHVMLRDLKNLFIPKLIDKKVELIYKLEKFPKYILIDETRLRQILINLVSNAVKFTDQGYVRITAKCNNISSGRGNVEIRVEDTGIGISEKYLDNIFDVFYQENWTNNRTYGGTGLGLSISKRLIEKMNGKIFVTSKVNEGSIFTVSINDVEVIEKNQEIGETSLNSISKIRFENANILVVDDIEFNRILIKEYLSKTGLNIFEAENSLDTFKILNKHDIDLILMDLKLPDIDGLQLTEMIKSIYNKKKYPIIAFTASAIKLEDDANHEYFDGHLLKPLKFEELIKELSKHLKLSNKTDQVDQINLKNDVNSKVQSTDVNLVIEAIKKYEDELLPGIEYLSKFLILNEIGNLINNIDSINYRAQIPQILDFTYNLNNSLKRYDVKNIKNILSSFKDLISKIKQEYYIG